LMAVLVAACSSQAVWRVLYPMPYPGVVYAASQRYGVKPWLVAAVIRAESKGHADALSGRGAIGLMQIMPATGAWAATHMGINDFSSADLRNPATNVAIGTWYLRGLLDRYHGNLALALAAYNGGEHNVDRWLASRQWVGAQGTEEQIPFGQTRDFVRSVLASYEAYHRLYPSSPNR
jgi:soluble lytic murein transglycosylase